jgi:hypothetical protein
MVYLATYLYNITSNGINGELIFWMDLEGNGVHNRCTLMELICINEISVRVANNTDSIRTKNLPRAGLQVLQLDEPPW